MMSQSSAAQDASSDPFRSVDAVSGDIFDRLIGIENPEDLSATQAEVVKSRLQKLGAFLLDAGANFGTPEAEVRDDAPPPFDFTVVVEGVEEREYFGLSRQSVERRRARAENARQAFARYQAERVSYHAARERANLPEGIELLEGRSSQYSEDAIMSAIRVVMVEQKRQVSRKSLPDLAPAPVIEPTPLQLEHEALPEQRVTLADRLRGKVAEFYKKDLVLAVSLTLWLALLIAMIVDPKVFLPLLVVSFYGLLMYLAIFRPGTIAKSLSALWKRRASAN